MKMAYTCDHSNPLLISSRDGLTQLNVRPAVHKCYKICSITIVKLKHSEIAFSVSENGKNEN
jgi:hypothetical protein